MDLPSRLAVKTSLVNFTADHNALSDYFLMRLAQNPQGEAGEKIRAQL